MTVHIFSSLEAAFYGPVLANYGYKMHGVYVHKDETHEDYVTIAPDGYRTEDPLLITRIDLPVTGTPACKLEIGGRCLLEFQHMYYPTIDDTKIASGQVTLTGTIQRDGTVSGVAVVSAKVQPVEQWSLLVNFAMKNLRTWRFEPGKHTDAVRITYQFEVTKSPLSGKRYGVVFRLPDEVRLQTMPLGYRPE